MYRLDNKKLYIERMVFLIAGIFVLSSVVFGFYISYKFFYFTGFVGFMLINFVITGFCPMAILLEKLGFKSINNK